MKYFSLLFIAFLFAGCTRNGVEITGQTKGITNGTITLKDASGQMLAGVNIKDGKFTFGKINIDQPDYGTITLSQPGKEDINFQLYLEPGAYNVVFEKDILGNYPQVTSKSVVQNQLSAYCRLFERMSIDANKRTKALDEKYQQAVKSSTSWSDSTTALADQTQAEHKKLGSVDNRALMAYITANPDNKIAAILCRIWLLVVILLLIMLLIKSSAWHRKALKRVKLSA